MAETNNDVLRPNLDFSEYSVSGSKGFPGNDPYEYKQGAAFQGEAKEPALQRSLKSDYQPMSPRAIESMSGNFLYNMTKVVGEDNIDSTLSDPNKMSAFMNKYIGSVRTKNGYNLSDQDTEVLTERIKQDAATWGHHVKAIRFAEKAALNFGENVKKASEEIDLENKKLKADAINWSKSTSEKIKSKYSLDVTNLETWQNSEFEKIQKGVNEFAKSEFNRIASEEIDNMKKSGMNEDEISSVIDSDQFSAKIEKQVSDITNARFKQEVDGLKVESAKRAKEINSKMVSEYDVLASSYNSSAESKFESTKKSIIDKYGINENAQSDFETAYKFKMKQFGFEAEAARWRNYRQNEAIGYASTPVASAIISGASRLKSMTMDIISDAASNLFGSTVTPMELEYGAKAQAERESLPGYQDIVKSMGGGSAAYIKAALDPQFMGGSIAEQLPILAVSVLPSYGAGLAVNVMSKLMGAARYTNLVASGAAAGMVELQITKQFNNREIFENGVRDGLSSEQIRAAQDYNSKTLNLMLPLYAIGMAQYFKPTSFMKGYGVEVATEVASENLENRASEIAQAKASGVDASFWSGNVEHAIPSLMSYLTSDESIETTAATAISSLTTTFVMNNLSGGVNKKLTEKYANMLYHGNGPGVGLAVLDHLKDSGKITEEEHTRSVAEFKAVSKSITKAAELGLNDVETVGVAMKMGEISVLESRIATEQDEIKRSQMESSIKKLKSEVSDIASGKTGVILMKDKASIGAVPSAISVEDLKKITSTAGGVEAILNGSIDVSVSNNPEAEAILKDISGKKTIEQARKQAISEVDSNKDETAKVLTLVEAEEFVNLATKKNILSKNGLDLSDQDKIRYEQLKEKRISSEGGYRAIEDLNNRMRDKSFANEAEAKSHAESVFAKFKDKFPGMALITDPTEILKEYADTNGKGKDWMVDEANGVIYENALVEGGGTEKRVLYSIDPETAARISSEQSDIKYSDGKTRVYYFKGLNTGTKVLYNPKAATKDTIYHELVGHSYVNDKMSKAATKDGSRSFSTSESLDYLVGDLSDQELSDLNSDAVDLRNSLLSMKGTSYEVFVRDVYSGLGDGAILEEALVTSIGDGGAKIENGKWQSWRDRAVEYVNKLVDWAKTKVGIKDASKIDSPKSFTNYVNDVYAEIATNDIIYGKPNESSGGIKEVFSAEVKTSVNATYKYTKESKEFNDLVNSGHIRFVKDLSDLHGENVVVTFPDGAMVGEVMIGDQVVFTGHGGMFYAAEHNKTSGIWAVGGLSMASRWVNAINGIIEKTGKPLQLLLVSGSYKQTISSASGASGAMKIFDFMFMNNMISKSQLRNALIKAKNEVGLDTVGIKVPVSGSTAKEIHDYLYNTFIDPENSSFAGRVKFVEKFIKHIIGERTGSNLSKEASEFLRKTLSVEQDRITPAIAIPAIGRLFTEPLLKDVPPGKVYAYITIQGRVEKVKQLSSEGHNSYNYAIEHIDKSMRNIINIVDGEHGSYYDNVIPVSGGKMDNSANTKSGVRSSGFTIAVYDHTGEISNKINEKVNASISPAKIDDFSDGGIASIYNKSNWAIVTGTRSVNGSYDSEKNIRANKNLKKELSKLGYKFIEANGVYKNVPDGPVYIVVGISERDAMDLGKKYGQESVLTRSGNMYSDGSMFNKSADNVFTGSEALSKDAYTILPDGSVFSLDLNFDESDPILSGGIDAKDSLLLLKENESLQKQDSVVNQVGSSVKESKMAPSEGRVLIPSNWDIDSDGNDFLFYHYGNIVGDTINPNYWGRSYYTSDKRHNGVSYYYTKSNQQEGMVGGDVHVVRVPKYKVYPFDIDPLGFRDFAQKDFEAKWPGYAFDEEQAIDFMNPLLEKAGFEMTVATWGPFPLRAETTKALKFDKKTSKTIREQGGIGPEFRKKKLELDIINKLHSASARPSRNKELIRDTFYSMGGSDINVNEAINNPTLSKAIGKKLIDEYKSIESSFKYSSDPGLKNVQMKGPKASLVGTRHSRLVLDKAKMLESAIRMEEAGSTQEDIFYATGFWRSFEGRWVMEISDYSASIKMLPAEGSVYKLDQIVGHETLYKIYPQLRDVVVTSEPFVEAPELVADFKSEDVRKIRINSLALEKLEEGDNVLTDIIHEIQHAIQDIEGLENGTSPYYSDGKYLEYQGLIKSWENAVSLMRSNPSLKGDPQFKSIWDNVEFLAGEISRFYAVKKMADGLQAKNGFTAGQSYYLLFHGEAVANIAEGSMGMTQKEIDATPFSLRHVVSDNNRVVDINTTISVMRAQVINNAFLSGSPSFGPGKELFIPESKASLQSGDVNQYLKNQKQAMGVSMKAAANYFSGINETPEEKEARKQLRDQISLEIMAAKLAYEMAQEEKAKALAYQKKELEIAHSFNMKDLADRLMEKMNRAIRREQADGAFRWLLEHEKWAEKMQTLDGYKEMVNALLSDYSRRGAFNGVINAKNAAQLAKLINNANTSSSLNRALAYLDKMIESKRYSEVISSIRDLKAKIKARIRGQKSAYGNKTDSVLNLLSLKEHQMLIISESGQSQFDLLYQYWAVLDGIANKPVPDFTGYADLYKNISSQYEGIISENYAADEFVDKLDGFDKLWKASQELLAQVANSAPDYISIRKAAGSINRKAYSLYKNGIITKDELKQFLVTLSKNSRSTDINIDEIRQVVEGIEEEAIESIGESLSKSQFHDLFDSISDTAKESVKFLLGEFSSKNVDHVKVLKEMGTDKILLLKSVIDQLFVVSDEDSTPYVSPKLYDLIRDYKVEKGSINILEAIDHAINEKRDAVGSIFARSKDKTRQQIYKSLFRMPAAMIDQALSLGKSGAYWKNVMNDLSSSDSNASIKIRELNRRLYLIMYNRAGVKLGAMSQQSRYRVGIIMKQMDYQANHPDFASLDDERKDAMRYLLERDRNKATYSDSEVKEIQKAYDSLPKHPNGNLDVESALKSLSDREASLIKEMRSMFESDLLPMIQHANELRGEVTESQIDYYPKISRHNDPRYKDEDTTPSQIVSQLETYSIRSSASYSRKNGEIFWTELDPDRVMPRTIEQAAVDSIIGESVYVSLGVLSRSAEKNANISGYKSNMINALYDITRDSIVNHFTVRASNGTWIERAINNANAQARTLLLSDLTRPIKEYPSNYLKYMISEGGVSGIIESLASFSPIERKVMKKIFDRFDAPIMEKANHFTFEGGGDMGREGILRVYANALATMSDSSVAKNVWMNEFKKAFKSLSGNEFDVEAYDTDESYVSKVDDDVKDSVVAANMAVENISGPQSSVSAPYKIGWSRRGSWGAKLFGFMQSYNAFESKVLFENFRDVLSGENSGRGRAMRYVAGVVASNMAYTVLSYVVLNALKDSLSSEDEGDSLLDDVIQAFESMSTKKGATNVFISSLINLAAGGYGWAVKILAGMVYSFGDSILYESGYSKTKEGKAKVDAVKDAIYDYYYFSVMNVSQRGKQDPAINLLNTVPVFSLYALPLANTVVDYGQLAVNKFNGEELGHKEYMSYNLMLATSAMMSYFRLDYPGMATVHKMLKEKSKKPAPVKKAQKGQSVPWFMHVNENPSGEQSMSGSKE